MSSQSFVKAKQTGRYFEGLMRPVLSEMGMEVIDSESLSYREKKGYDCLVRINGASSRIEFKYDIRSQETGQVFIDLDSIRKSTAPIWIIGLPSEAQISTYSVLLSDLGSYAESYPIKVPGGEFRLPGALISKEIFVNLPFVKKFKTISV
jgi:hypothetical protein